MVTVQGNVRKAMRLARKGIGGANWYNSLYTRIEELHGKHAIRYCFILAVTSPNTSVQGNVTLANKAMDQWEAGDEFTGFLSSVCKALEMLRLQEEIFGVITSITIRGRKIRHFADAIIGEVSAVPVDRWMLRAFDFKSITPRRFDYIIDFCRENAAKLGLTPRELQAAIWSGIKAESEVGIRDNDSMLVHLT